MELTFAHFQECFYYDGNTVNIMLATSASKLIDVLLSNLFHSSNRFTSNIRNVSFDYSKSYFSEVPVCK